MANDIEQRIVITAEYENKGVESAAKSANKVEKATKSAVKAQKELEGTVTSTVKALHKQADAVDKQAKAYERSMQRAELYEKAIAKSGSMSGAMMQKVLSNSAALRKQAKEGVGLSNMGLKSNRGLLSAMANRQRGLLSAETKNSITQGVTGQASFNLPKGFYDQSSIMERAQRFSASAVGQGYDTSFSSGGGALGGTKFADAMVKGFSLAATAGQKVVSIMANITTSAARFGGNLLKAAYNVTPIAKAVEGVRAGLHKVSTLVGRIAKIAAYRAIRSAIKEISKGIQEGVKNLYEWSKATGENTFANSMDRAATSLLYLKNSVGAMISPIIDALVPALDSAIHKFVELINVANQFFATITGATTWRKALEYPTQWGEATKGAAKEMRRTLLGFDEINRLDAPNKGGSGSAMDYSSMFTTESVENAGMNFTDRLNEMIDNIDIEGAARKLGKKVTELLDKANKFFDATHWSVLGGKLADGFDGLLETLDPAVLGKALTNKINTVIETARGFVENFGWDAAGVWLGDLIDTWFGSIKWDDLESTISTAINGVFTFAQNFITKADWVGHVRHLTGLLNKMLTDIDWATLGATIGQFADTLIQGAKTFVTEFDWKGFATSVYTTLSSMLDKIDFAALGETVNGLIQGLIDGALTFIENVDWVKVGNDIYSFLSKIDFVDIFTKLGKLVLEAIKGMVQAVSAGLESSSLNNYGKGSTLTKSSISDHGNNAAITLTPKAAKSTLRANGGYPEQGSMFIAGEAGAEFVGNINGRTGVMNTDQFGEVMQPTTMAIYEIGNAIVGAVNNIPVPSVKIGDRDIYRASERGKRLTGSSLVQGAR